MKAPQEIAELLKSEETVSVTNYFKILKEDIHTVVMATADKEGLPATCAVDIMDYSENSLYFLTAESKDLYRRLKECGYASVTGIKGRSTMTSLAISVRGKVREKGAEKVKELFDKNAYMYLIYPDAAAQKKIRVFELYEGEGEIFDLSQNPPFKKSFIFGEKNGAE